METYDAFEKLHLETFAEAIENELKFHASIFATFRQIDFQFYNVRLGGPINEEGFLTVNERKAVFTLAYLFRGKCKELYYKKYHCFCKNSVIYRRFLMSREVSEDRYFLRVLAWISFAFEMTMCCYRKEFAACRKYPEYEHNVQITGVTPVSYIDTCKLCIRRYLTMNVLFNRQKERKWRREIQEAANHIAAFHGTLVEALRKRCLEREILPSFLVALKDILKLKEYKITMTEIMMFRDSPVKKYNRTYKLRSLLEYSPERIALGHTVVRRNKRANTPSNSSFRATEGRHSARENAQIVCGPSTSSDARHADVPRMADDEHFQFESYRNSSFVASSNKLRRIENERNSGKRDIKIYLPQREIIGKVENLYENLYENTVKDKCKVETDALFLVNPREGDSTPIILLDSSEEEEDDDERLRRSFMDDVLKNWKEFSFDNVEVMNFALSSQVRVAPKP